MKNINDCAVQAKADKNILETFIKENESFIISSASKATGCYITKSDDQYSIALSAFNEAVQAYDYDKGSFFGFAALVIRRRLIDYIRTNPKSSGEILVAPGIFEGSYEDDDEAPPFSGEIIAKVSYSKDDSLKLEIEAISAVLAEYSISFFDLADVSPKASKTKTACAKAIACVVNNMEVLEELTIKHTLPIKKIETASKVPKKILERHRKYIIAGAEIISGDYPHLAEYMIFVRKEL